MNGAAYPVVVEKIPDQRLDVAVEDDSNGFPCRIHGGAARVAANDVGCRNIVQRSCQIQLGLGLHPAFGQVVWLLVAVLGGVLVGAAHGGEVRNMFSVLRVTFHGAVTEPKGKCGIRRLIKATLSETGLGNGGSVVAFY